MRPPLGGPYPQASRPSIEDQIQHLRQRARENRYRRSRIREALRLQLVEADSLEQ